jgi:hypothetical protein
VRRTDRATGPPEKETEMARWIVTALVAGLLVGGGLCEAKAPLELGGFVLGAPVQAVEDRVRMASALPVRHMEFLEEVEIGDLPQFKSGYIAFGTCERPGQIVRIKLKYADSSRKFYDALVKRFNQRFGDPSEWRGDPFHMVIAWKWQFTEADGTCISLILQHNTRDTEEKMGNSVKLTASHLIEAERRCFEQRQPKPAPQEPPAAAPGPVDWELLVPR